MLRVYERERERGGSLHGAQAVLSGWNLQYVREKLIQLKRVRTYTVRNSRRIPSAVRKSSITPLVVGSGSQQPTNIVLPWGSGNNANQTVNYQKVIYDAKKIQQKVGKTFYF